MKGRQGRQGGFTLIELLIVVAILGVLAAVVIPNVGRFLGRGKTEAQKTELHNVQTAVMAMMTEGNISAIPVPVAAATADMAAFPDATTLGAGTDKKFLLWQADIDANAATAKVNYVTFATTQCLYTVTGDGTVTQASCP